MIIRKVYKSNTNGQRLVSIPMDSDIQAGDYVKIIKVEDKE